MFDNYIPNRFKKWLTLIGGFLISFALGTLYTASNMNPYIISYLREYKNKNIRYSDTAYMSVPSGLILAIFNVISALLISKNILKPKVSLLIGIILTSSGTGLTYFTIQESYPLTILTHIAMFAMGFGFTFIPSLSTGVKWFVESRGKASSFIAFGLGSSSLVLDQIQTLYINPDNYSPDKPYSDKYPNEKYFSQKDLLERVPKCFLILASIYLFCQVIGFMMMFDKTEENITEDNQNKVKSEKLEIDDETCTIENEVNSIGVKYKDVNEGMDLRKALRQKSFYIFSLIFCFLNMGSSLMVSNYKIFGQTFINDDKFLALVGSISSIFNATGRIFWGYLIDKIPFKLCHLIYSSAALIFVGTAYLNIYMNLKGIYMFWICCIYFFTSAIQVSMPVGILKTFGQKNFNAIYGLVSLSMVPGSFLAGYIGSTYYQIGWFYVFLIGAIFLLFNFITGLLFNVKKSNGDNI